MKIYVLGSNSFVDEMVSCKDKLLELGFDGWIHADYEAHVRGQKKAFPDTDLPKENAAFKKANDYIRAHYKHILESDAVLIVNSEKRGIRNYIGGNCLMEMGQAYVNGKKIFLLNGIPEQSSYLDEILAMEPVCLNGDLMGIAR